jgi:hypothetical protein
MGKKAKLALIALVAAGIIGLVLLRAREHRRTNNPGGVEGIAANTPWPGPSSAPGGAESRPGQGPASPVRIGESLSYRLSWSTIATAATATISVPNRLYFFGDDVWDFRAQVSTVNPVRRLFTIDDQFTSYADVQTMASRQYIMRLSELGRNRTRQFRTAQIWGTPARANDVATTQAGSSPAGSGDTGGFEAIPAAACDPLSALFLLRMADWARPVEARVFDGRQVYEMTAQRVGVETVAVPAGKFAASRINVELRGSSDPSARVGVTIWLARDAYRTPVIVETTLPFGSLHLELTSRTSGR